MKISVVIPTRNRVAWLERSLAALAAQEGAPQYEVIVVDNGSTDATEDILRGAATQLPLYRVFEPEPNRARARNRGLALATGDIVVFMDDDVLVPAGYLRAHADAHAESQSVVVSGPILNVASWHDKPLPSWQNFSRAFFCTCNVSVARSALEAVGKFDEGFNRYGWEDTDLGLRLRRFGAKHRFAWDAYVYHLKPAGWESLADAQRRMTEKALMARRLSRKEPSWRVRLATGDYPLNYIRAAVFAPVWAQGILRGIAESSLLPKPVRSMARAQYLDGIYVATLRSAGGEY